MTDTATLELLEARARIADLVHRYAQIIRTGDVERCPELFTADAVFEIREMTPGDAASVSTRARLAGRDAILQYVSKSASGGSVCPLIHNLLIEVQGTSATSTAVMAAVTWADGRILYGEYRDSFRRDDVWRFSGRVFTIYTATRAPAAAQGSANAATRTEAR